MTRAVFIFLVAIFGGQAAVAESAGREVAYFGDTKGYLVLPDAPKAAPPSPALILIHEWWGLNDDIRAKAHEFAAAGYVALAVDLYGGETATTPDAARKLAGAVRDDSDTAFANLRAAADYLRELPRADGARLGSVGWCFGGGWSYQIAKNDLGAKASVIYYGRFNPADDLSQMRARIIGHFGEKDAAIKLDDVRQFQARLQTHSGAHEVFIYPNAGHGFANPDNPSFDETATNAAWNRTLDFLRKNL